MVDPTLAKVARMLRVADADVRKVIHDVEKNHYVVDLVDGGKVLLHEAGKWFALNDHRSIKNMERAPAPESAPTEQVSKPEPQESAPSVEVPAPVAVEDDVPNGTANDVISWVGDDKDKASRALEAERAKDKPRSVLITTLERIADG